MDSNTQENNDYQFLLFYVYHLIKEPTEICVTVETECKQLKMGGRVRISSEGSNGIVGGSSLSISQFKESFSTITCIESSLVHWFQSGLVASIPVNQQVFSSLSIQVTKEVVSLDVKSDMYGKLIATGAGTYLTPQEFHAMLGTLDKSTSSRKSSSLDSSTLEHTSNFELLDIRNHYEVRIGTFSGDSFVATNPETRQFSDIIKYFDEHAESLKGKKVLMYCTGGVRCERASAYLKLQGVDEVYHLRGGIHAYQEAYGDAGYFKGKNFVFDPRIAISNQEARSFATSSSSSQLVSPYVDSSDSTTPVSSASASTVVGSCLLCQMAWDDYSPRHRCASCRMLILVCTDCTDKYTVSPPDCELCSKKRPS